MVEFNWLHLTDLHWGMQNFDRHWPSASDNFYAKLRELLAEKAELNSLDLVLFTGDLVYSGRTDQFKAVNEKMIEELWKLFDDLNLAKMPELLAVPGNHDLCFLEGSPELTNLIHLWDNPDAGIEKEFWRSSEAATRGVVEKAFQNYVEWWRNAPHKPEIRDGILPGDFSTTIEKDGYKLGIVGLNSAFLQLESGPYQGKLALDSLQFHGACEGNDGPAWVKQHDLCLLLTHHPRDWLAAKYKEVLDGEIHQPRLFALHLFGHMHEFRRENVALGGGEPRRRLQGCSLFALDGWGKEENNERTHGFSLGQLKIEDDKACMRTWPLKSVKRDAMWDLVPNHEFGELPDGWATRWEVVKEGIPPRRELSASNGSHDFSRGSRGIAVPPVDPRVVDMAIQGALNDSQQSVVDAALTTRLNALKQSLVRVKEHPFSWRLRQVQVCVLSSV